MRDTMVLGLKWGKCFRDTAMFMRVEASKRVYDMSNSDDSFGDGNGDGKEGILVNVFHNVFSFWTIHIWYLLLSTTTMSKDSVKSVPYSMRKN